MNINCGSADSLSLNPRVRLYDDCVAVGGKGGEGGKGGKAVRRVGRAEEHAQQKSRTII